MEEEAENEPTHQQLWRTLQEEREELRDLRKRWPDTHWTVRGAIERVEAAEEAWRKGRPEVAQSRKLQRAEQAVKRANGRVDSLQGKLNDLEEDYRRRKEELAGQLRDARAKLQEAQGVLREVKLGVAEDGRGDSDGNLADQAGENAQVLRQTVDVLGKEIGPQLLLVSEMFDDGSDGEAVKATFRSVVSKLHAMYGVLQSKTEQDQAADGRHFRLADEESELPELTEADYAQYGTGYEPQGDGWQHWNAGGGHWQGHGNATTGGRAGVHTRTATGTTTGITGVANRANVAIDRGTGKRETNPPTREAACPTMAVAWRSSHLTKCRYQSTWQKLRAPRMRGNRGRGESPSGRRRTGGCGSIGRGRCSSSSSSGGGIAQDQSNPRG